MTPNWIGSPWWYKKYPIYKLSLKTTETQIVISLKEKKMILWKLFELNMRRSSKGFWCRFVFQSVGKWNKPLKFKIWTFQNSEKITLRWHFRKKIRIILKKKTSCEQFVGGVVLWKFGSHRSYAKENKTKNHKNVKLEMLEKDLDIWWIGSFPQKLSRIRKAVSDNPS